MPPEWFTAFWSSDRQWELLLPVAFALLLSTLIGLEREAGAKSAGLRTHVLVGVGSAVFMLVSNRSPGRARARRRRRASPRA